MTFIEKLQRFLRTDRDRAPKVRPVAGESAALASAADGGRHLDLYRSAVDGLARGDTDAAERKLHEVLKLRHDFAEAHLTLGQLYHGRGRLDDASDCYILATHFRADLPAAHLRLGLLAHDRGQFQEAQGYLERAIKLKPDDAVAHNALGAALLRLGRIDAAEDRFREALKLQPRFAKAHSNLGYLLFRELERFGEGAQHIATALELAPHDETALCNWTMVLQQQGRFEEALALTDRLLGANPALNEVRINRALMLLTMGEFECGWRDYEARKRMPPFFQGARPWPEWDGEARPRETLLVYAEQGIGDEIMFSSCFPEAIRAVDCCIIECSPKLAALFARSFPAARVVAKRGRGLAETGEWRDQPVDRHIAAGSLPRLWRKAWTDFPRHAGYLAADPLRVAHWKSRLSQLGAGLKVGISWRGGMRTSRRSLRSVPLEQWLPILRTSGAHFVSLQYTDARAEISEFQSGYGLQVHLWREALDEFDETAALVCALDLVITVQTAVGHLAGALGKSAWVMISAVPEWRYLKHGEDMPWYPAVRMFRQTVAGEWNDVVQSIARRLHEQVTRVDSPGPQPTLRQSPDTSCSG